MPAKVQVAERGCGQTARANCCSSRLLKKVSASTANGPLCRGKSKRNIEPDLGIEILDTSDISNNNKQMVQEKTEQVTITLDVQLSRVWVQLLRWRSRRGKHNKAR